MVMAAIDLNLHEILAHYRGARTLLEAALDGLMAAEVHPELSPGRKVTVSFEALWLRSEALPALDLSILSLQRTIDAS